MKTSKKITFNHVTYLLSDDLPCDKEQSFYESLFDRESIMKSPDVTTCDGRGKTIIFSMYGKKLVLRHYRRGGLFGKIVQDKFFVCEPNAHRARDEFELLSYMLSVSLPVPKPFIARERSLAGTIEQDIVIECLDGYKDLSKIICSRSLTQDEFKAIGQTIGKFFKENIHHTDLNIRNILLNDNNEVCVIDFDKCFHKFLSIPLKNDMLNRLLRSFKKEQSKSDINRIFFNESDFDILRKEALKS